MVKLLHGYMVKKIIMVLVCLVILLMAWSPWMSSDFVKLAINKRPEVVKFVDIKKVPFGFFVEVDVSACPICPALVRVKYFVSPIFSVHKI
jgi:hypothetical protein